MVNPTQSNFRPNDLHRVFMQSILSRRVASEDLLLELYKRAISAVTLADEDFRPTHGANKAGLRTFLRDINTMLDQNGLQMELRVTKDEDNKGKETWALINTDATEEAYLMTDYEPNQIAYFKLVVQEIIESYPANSVGQNVALKLTSDLQSNMTKLAADILLGSFVARGWLNKSKRGRFALAPRAILELENWLKNQYEEYIQICGRCSKLVFTGVICGNEDCKSHIHKTCYTILHSVARPKCPKCESPISDDVMEPLGEKAVRTGEDNATQVRGKKRKPGNGKGKGRQGSDDEDEAEGTDQGEEDEEESARSKDKSSGVLAGTGPSKWKVAKSGRPKRGAAATGSEEE